MAPPSPYDDPIPRGWKFVQGTLRVAVCMQCTGLALAHLSAGQESSAAGLLRAMWDANEIVPGSFSKFAGYGLSIAALFTLLRPSWPVLLAVVFWFGAEAAAPVAEDGQVVELLQRVLRVALPLVLLLVDFWPPPLSFSIGRAKVALGLLRLALVTSVSAGGVLKLFAIEAGGDWTDRLHDAALSAGLTVSDGQVSQCLAVMLAVDFALAWSSLTSRNRLSLGLLAVWLVALAAVWIAALGSSGYANFLLDASAAGAPLAVLLFWVCAIKEQPPVIVPG
ncbi:MAG: hypothetical protein JNG89_01880 [Planctomycetaceae bacterium]|nr:hypothetical protein [Planctomycetaceae bacterium]